MPIKYKNVWGSAGSNLEQQRSDLFKVSINLPGAGGNGVAAWEQQVQFAITKFPFPNRTRETIPVKYLQQVNYQLGGDTPQDPITITARYGFTQSTAEALERWHWQIAHPGSGGVSLTSSIKTFGYFYWLVPNQKLLTNEVNRINDAQPADVMQPGATYVLEGVLLTGLKPTDADMEQGNQLVYYEMTISIDRYYPIHPSDLKVPSNESVVGNEGLVSR